MTGVSAAAPAPLSMTAASHGSALDLTFTNTTQQPVTLTTKIRATHDNVDWLTVTLVQGKTTRTLTFIESRKKAVASDETIAAGASIVVSVDLVSWSMRASNGEPLRDGTYDVTATWDTTKESKGPRFTATAKTKLVVEKPVDRACKNKGATTGLELLAHQLDKTTIELGVHNVDKVAHCIEAYIHTHEQQSDQLAIDVPTSAGPRHISFSGGRDKSYPILVELPPGATSWTSWDVADWAARTDKHPLPKGASLATATYDGSHVHDGWHGTIQTTFVFTSP